MFCVLLGGSRENPFNPLPAKPGARDKPDVGQDMMCLHQLQPDVFTFSSLISACEKILGCNMGQTATVSCQMPLMCEPKVN